MPGRRNIFLRLWDAVVHPQKWEPPTAEAPRAPDVVSEQPQPAKRTQPAKRAQPAKKAQPAKRAQPARKAPASKATPPPTRTRIIPRNQLPEAWGPNKAALWQEASRRMPNGAASDWRAQALYDAALYSLSETNDVRHAIQEELFRYIRETYGVDFKNIFDWTGYREAYDAVAASQPGGDFGAGGEVDV